MSEAKYKANCYVSEAVKNQMKEDIKKMALACLGTRKLDLQYRKGGFDPYTYCQHDMKKHCKVGEAKKYRGYIKPGGYTFYGDSCEEIYLEIINFFAIRGSITPMIYTACSECNEIKDRAIGSSVQNKSTNK